MHTFPYSVVTKIIMPLASNNPCGSDDSWDCLYLRKLAHYFIYFMYHVGSICVV